MIKNMINAQMNFDSCMGSEQSDREALLFKLQAYEFALLEVGLFLNNHPHDQNALAYFNHYREIKHQVESEYTRMYGPITMDHKENDLCTWKWIDNPWPWEIGSEV